LKIIKENDASAFGGGGLTFLFSLEVKSHGAEHQLHDPLQLSFRFFVRFFA